MKTSIFHNLLVIPSEVLDLIYPRWCKICDIRLSQGSIVCFCKSCWDEIKFINPPYCKKCGIPYPLAQNSDSFVCGNCINNKSYISKIRAIGIYDGVLRKAIHEFKYKGKSKLGFHLANLMIKKIKENQEIIEFLKDVSFIIPVPLHRSKLKEREYNQSEILANLISKEIDIPVENNIIKRIKVTRPQSELKEEERQKNVKGVFEVKRNEKIEGKILLLIDDIVTTGATVEECAKVLIKSGANEIRVLSLSR